MLSIIDQPTDRHRRDEFHESDFFSCFVYFNVVINLVSRFPISPRLALLAWIRLDSSVDYQTTIDRRQPWAW
jgi:hypothetical protein